MPLQDAPVASGDASLPPNAPAAVAPDPQEPPPAASLASIPLCGRRRRAAAPAKEPHAAPRVAPPRDSGAAQTGSDGSATLPTPGRPAEAAPTSAAADCVAAAQRPAPSPTQPEPGLDSEAGSGDGDIVAFWKTLRGERRFPSWTDLQFERCAAHWPNSLLLRFPADNDSAPPRIEAAFGDAMRAATLRADARSRIDHTPLVTDWLIALSQEAARACRPVSDEQVLPSWRGPTRYRAVALPFSEDQAEIDHVLCHVAHA